MSNPTPIDVTPRQLAALLDMSFAADIPLMIWGDGGIGKSRITEQAALRHGREYCDFRALIKDLPDLQGYPIPHDMRPGAACPMTAPADLPASDDARAHALVIEELPGAPRMLQGALYGLILERRLNSYSLPADTRVVCTGNLATSGGVIQTMPKPLANRLMHCRLICAPDEHLAYAQDAGWHSFVTAYHAMTKGAEWFSFDAKSPEETYASPRAWEMMSRTLQAGRIPSDMLTQVCAGTLGYGIGAKFAAFVRLYADLAPTLDQMKVDPKGCPIPADAAAQWFIAAVVAQQASAADMGWLFPLVMRLPDELAVFSVDSIRRRDASLLRCRDFVDFARNPRYQFLAQYLTN